MSREIIGVYFKKYPSSNLTKNTFRVHYNDRDYWCIEK